MQKTKFKESDVLSIPSRLMITLDKTVQEIDESMGLVKKMKHLFPDQRINLTNQLLEAKRMVRKMQREF